jgi:hypothetical protein
MGTQCGPHGRGGVSVSGGTDNHATETASISGGYKNLAEGTFASIFGGKEQKATGYY